MYQYDDAKVLKKIRLRKGGPDFFWNSLLQVFRFEINIAHGNRTADGFQLDDLINSLDRT
jgi:hypothetical protein